jgi:hypothetical protein
MHTGSKWTFPMALWVSRKDADGMIYHVTVPMWLFIVFGFIILANVLVWGVIGLVEAAEYVL